MTDLCLGSASVTLPIFAYQIPLPLSYKNPACLWPPMYKNENVCFSWLLASIPLAEMIWIRVLSSHISGISSHSEAHRDRCHKSQQEYAGEENAPDTGTGPLVCRGHQSRILLPLEFRFVAIWGSLGLHIFSPSYLLPLSRNSCS